MVNWNSPEQILRGADILSKLDHVLAGVYFWEFITSLDFEYAYLSRQKTYRWPITFYFLGRYLMLGYIIAELISVNVTAPILNCQGLMTYISLGSAMCSGLASVNLAMRAVAVWRGTRSVIVGLVILGLAQWAFILQSGDMTAFYAPGEGCIIIVSSYAKTLAQIALTMTFDFTVMMLVTYKLQLTSRGREKTQLVNQLYRDGIFYFLIVFIFTAVATVMVSINLSPVMNGIFLTPSSVVATIGACRAVRRLNTFFGSGDSTAATGASVVFKLNTRNPASQVTVTREVEVNADELPTKEPSSTGGLHFADRAFPSKSSGGTFDAI